MLIKGFDFGGFEGTIGKWECKIGETLDFEKTVFESKNSRNPEVLN